jgi:hypothetical protein
VTTANIGRAPFRYTYVDDTWWWSEEIYRIFGFAPGEVVPTTELIMRHVHPDDVESAVSSAREQLVERGEFCVWHRIVDARRRVRQLLTHGQGVLDEATGELREVRGASFDVTRALRIAYSRDVDEAVRAAGRTRDVIEQAKGVLMLTQRIGAEEAFELLRRCSQATNVKVRDLAGSVMTAVVQTGQLPAAVRTGLLAGQLRRRIPASLADAAGVDGSDGGAEGNGRAAAGPDGDPVG